MKSKWTRHVNAASEEGFTIVELLVAVVILVFVSVALLQTAIINIEFNAKNALRDEGVRLAGERINQMRNASNLTLVAVFHGTTGTTQRRVRNMDVQYTVTNTVTAIDTYGNKFGTVVQWQWKGEILNTAVYTVR